ncbi:MAG: hypothetical protein Q7K37_04595 [Dehalococcoidia bacterium]|nr:hypothetical protein [Dehalococcoidia bacterium]
MSRVRGFAVRLGIILSVVLGTFMAAGPSASAEGPAAIFLGFVVPDADGMLATRVRAVGNGGAVCGTADVTESGESVGFYALRVSPASAKAGCPAEGETVRFTLLYGNIDDGTFANPNGNAQFRGAQAAVVHLAPASSTTEITGWVGPLPTSGGRAVALIWDGPDHTPVEQALQTLGVEIAGAWHIPPGAQRYLSYLPGAPAFIQSYVSVQAGDVVTVRAR